jgi:phage tail sheath protein FI
MAVALTLRSPGVRREDVFLKPQVALATGVPGFVGVAQPTSLLIELAAIGVPGLVALAKPGAPQGPFPLRRKQELAENFILPKDGFLSDAVAAFFDNGGERCYVVGTAGRDTAALEAAIDMLAPVDDLDLLVVPDAIALSDNDATEVQRHAIAHCAAQGDRFAILDAPRKSTVDALLARRDALLLGQREPVSAALYYPWLTRIVDGKPVPPSGAVAGIFARTDARVGVHKAPANQEVTGALDLETDVDTATQDRLNPEGINCLRVFPGRGIRVWGARTLSRDPAWRYVNVRRLVLTLRRWIALNLAWAGFEPNGPLLWVRIERELRGHLTGLWRAGALSGDTADAAFYIKCDSETNPPERRDNGEVVTEIGLAPNPPAEFAVIRIAQREGAAQLLAL